MHAMRRAIRRLSTCMTALLALPLSLGAQAARDSTAQAPAPAAFGDRVRIHPAGPGFAGIIEGKLVRIESDSIAVMWKGRAHGLARTDVTRAEVFVTQPGGALRGAVLGLLVGGAIGGVAGSGGSKTDSGDTIQVFSESDGQAIGAVLFGVVGLALGAMIGSNIPMGRWRAAIFP